jgi:hypothetical protein
MKKLAEEAGSSLRMLDHTEAYKLLTDSNLEDILEYAIKCDNPGISASDIKDTKTSILYDASKTTTSDGFWATISRRFASETTGDAWVICCNASDGRIFELDELVTWCKTAPDSATLNGVSKSEILAMDESTRFDFLKNLSKSEFADAKVYVNEKGYIVGRSYEGTALEGYIN